MTFTFHYQNVSEQQSDASRPDTKGLLQLLALQALMTAELEMAAGRTEVSCIDAKRRKACCHCLLLVHASNRLQEIIGSSSNSLCVQTACKKL